MLGGLQGLVANNTYYHNIHIDPKVLALLPEDGNLSGLCTVNLETTASSEQDPSQEDIDSYHANLPRLFVPSTSQKLTELETQCRILRAVSHLNPHHGQLQEEHQSVCSPQRAI